MASGVQGRINLINYVSQSHSIYVDRQRGNSLP